MHLELIQFLVRHELGVLVSVGPTKVGLEVVPKGPVHHGHACCFLVFQPDSLVTGPRVNFGSVHVREAQSHFEERGGELFRVTIDDLVTHEFVQEQLGLVTVTVKDWRRHSRECTTSAVTRWVYWGWCWCAHSGADIFQATRIHRSSGCDVKGFGGGERRVHHVAHVTVLGVHFGPMAKAKFVVVFDLIRKARHIGVFHKLFLAMKVEPRVSCVCVLGLVLILIGKEFDGGAFADFGVFDPISGAFAMPLGRSFNVGWEVVCCTTFNDGVDFLRVSKYNG